MSRCLHLAVLVALGLAWPCAASEPVESAGAATPAVEPAPAVVAAPAAPGAGAAPVMEAPAGADPAVPTPLPIFAPLAPTAPPPSPLLPPLLAPAPPPAPAEPAIAAESVPPAAAAPGPALRSGQEVFARLRRGLAPDACNAGSNSARWRNRYAASPVTFSRRIESVLPLLDFVGTEVERAGLPAEFAFIPLVESWYQPAVVGPGGPTGMWQMIASTARNHGIHIRDGYDGRLSPVESTRAALSYLKVLGDMFGNWQAIVMAYNAGEGRLQRAFRRAGSRSADAAQRKPHGLSNITYDYVAKLQALSCLVQQPQRQGLRLPVDARFEPLVPLLMDAGVSSLEQFAARHGKDAGQLRRLNPGFRNGRVVAGVPRLVLAPPGVSLPVAAAAVAVAPPEPATAPVEIVALPAGASLVATTTVVSVNAGAADPVLVPAAMPPVQEAPPAAAAAPTAPTSAAPKSVH